MPDLASCYFCGTIAGSVSERPIADAPDAPPELDRTILLCQSCREKLDTILEPVFDQESTDTSGQSTADTTPDTASNPDPEDASMTWPEAKPSQRRADRDDTHQSTTASPELDRDGNAQETDKEEPTPEPDEPAAKSGDENEDATESTKPRAEELPDGTRQVLRLLRNREFPVNRAEIEEVARNAYELDRNESRRVIEALIDHDILREVDGQLQPND
ncbi:MAG: hypothetical protein SVG88_11910 [Halobacteriales archaeon]|nr:hypothetical protein [Halobacteriales archaeon]